LDGSGEKISEELSEVDLSNPEDVQALIPDHSTEILVHFGEDNFLERYRRFKEHLPEWRTLYPKLSSVDMRYEQQVVLQMPPGSAGSGAPSSNAAAGPASDGSALKAASPVAGDGTEKSVLQPSAKVGDKLAHKPAAKASPVVPAKKSVPKAKPHAAAPKHHPVVTTHPTGTTQHHPTQVANP
jgi:cell division protein FtsQ